MCYIAKRCGRHSVAKQAQGQARPKLLAQRGRDLCILTSAILATSCGAFAEEEPPKVDLRSEVNATCDRPFPPDRGLYGSRGEFNAARERYYVEASAYVSQCVDMWIEQARLQYQQLFQIEAQAYLDERAAVMEELRAAASEEY